MRCKRYYNTSSVPKKWYIHFLTKLGPTPLTAQKIWIHGLKPLGVVFVPTLIKLDLVEKCGRYEGFSKKDWIEKCRKWVTSGHLMYFRSSKMPIFCPYNTQKCVLMLVCLFVCPGSHAPLTHLHWSSESPTLQPRSTDVVQVPSPARSGGSPETVGNGAVALAT